MKIDRQTIYSKFNGRCAYCGVEIQLKDMQVDHIIPQSFFAQHIYNKFRVPKFLEHLYITDVNHIDNLHPSCRVCNKWKSANDLELFRHELSEQLKRLNLYSANYRIAKKYSQIEEKEQPIIFYFEQT